MTRLLVHVEGETEEDFVNKVLAPHLYSHGFSSVGARLIGNARQRDRRGGIRAWSTVRKDIMNHLKEDRASIATTMVDYYGLPQIGPKAWPGRLEASKLAFSEKANRVETALLEDISREMGSSFDQERVHPVCGRCTSSRPCSSAIVKGSVEGFGHPVTRPEAPRDPRRIC